MKKFLFLVGMVLIGGFGVLFFLNKKNVINNVDSNKNKTVSNIEVFNTKSTVNLQEVRNDDKFVQNEYHPIIFTYKDKNGMCSNAKLVGGSKDGNWFNLENQTVKVNGQRLEKDCLRIPGDDKEGDIYAEIDMAKGGETYRFYSLNEYLDSSEGMKPTIWINGHTGDKIFPLGIKPFKVKNEEDLIIGINARWNALPRIPKKIDANTFAIDLDNDGKIEKITREEKKNEEVGSTTDVSFIVDKQNTKLPIGEYPSEIDGVYVRECHLFILDLNGDKKMELIISEDGHNESLTVYELTNDKIKDVMGYYNGD